MTVSKDHSIAFAWSGIIGVAVFFITWACAASVDTAWQFGVNNLSDLGVSDTNASMFFNYGCMITGILLLIFGIGRTYCSRNLGHIAAGILLIIGGIGLFFVGVYTSDQGDIHRLVAITAGLFIFLAIVAAAAGNWAADRKLFAGIGIIIAFLLVAMFVAFDIAKLEAYGIILAMIWLSAESANMILSKRKS